MESNGWKWIFVENDEVPLIIQKSDGGFTYDSTDMAAINYRFNHLNVDNILYCTDMGQKDHFRKVFKAAQKSQYYNPSTQTPIHIGFGLMLGEDGGKIKSRTGDSVKLNELLDEATERAFNLLNKRKNQPQVCAHLKGKDLRYIAEIIGINSIKYFDLKQSRTSSYKFSFDKMLDTKGNTGVYITYMYVRICSILKKAFPDFSRNEDILDSWRNFIVWDPQSLKLQTKEEISLALSVLRLPESIDDALKDYQMSKVWDHLYNLSVKFAEFYQNNKVIGHENEKSRLILICAAKIVMEKQMGLLGMKIIDSI